MLHVQVLSCYYCLYFYYLQIGTEKETVMTLIRKFISLQTSDTVRIVLKLMYIVLL